MNDDLLDTARLALACLDLTRPFMQQWSSTTARDRPSTRGENLPAPAESQPISSPNGTALGGRPWDLA